MSSHVVRRWCAALTALVGLMNIVSALYPALPERVELLRDVMPLHVMRASQTATVLTGFFLIVLADGLRKRRKRAMQLTVGLLLASCLLNLAKGLDYEEGAISVWLAVGLIVSRHEFRVRSPFPFERGSFQPAISFSLLYLGYLLGGFLVLRHNIRPFPSLGGAVTEPIRLLFGASPYTYLGPQAQWFQRSVIFVGAVLVLVVVLSVLRPLIPLRESSEADVDRVRRLVEQYGDDSLSYFSLQDGRRYFFDESREAVLSYRIQGTVALVGGDPIGRGDRLVPLCRAFIEFAESYGLEPCFLGVRPEALQLYELTGMNTLKIGEEALIDLPGFQSAALKRKVRRAARHVDELGIHFERYPVESIPHGVLREMELIWHEWIAEKGGSQRGFSMTLGRLPRKSDRGCEVVIAMRGSTVMGYLCLVPARHGTGWSLDAMRRRADSPNGLMEALIIWASESYRDLGYRTLSLNFATLSNSTNEIGSRALEATRRFLFDNMSGVYQLKSLYQFNSKFEPRWESRYVAFRTVRRMPKLAFAIVQSEDPIKIPLPIRLLR